MASIEVNDVSYHYPGAQAGVSHISFSVPEGKVVCLVGASGCGKSTVLKLVAGFLKPQAGRITIGGDSVAGRHWVPPEKRNIGLVFQNHALFPHLDVSGNILFGAKARSVLGPMLENFRLSDKAKRYPHELSGGEQQRVALARALAANPRALLMDEPFASIDSVLRRNIRSECIGLLRESGVTTLMVTHDAQEAMELADHILVMEHGRITQAGTAREIYFQPANLQVAGLFGDVNHITDAALAEALTGHHGEVLLRPELIEITDEEGVDALITQVHFRGSHNLLLAEVGPGIVLKVLTQWHHFLPGHQVRLRVNR